jgi:hypothetical protein
MVTMSKDENRPSDAAPASSGSSGTQRVVGQRITLDKLTMDQEEYLARLLETENQYDPTKLVGGSRKAPKAQ